MKMPQISTLACLCYFLTGAFFIAMWATLLFVAVPEKLSLAQATGQALQYYFSAENQARWFFVWIAIAPAIFLLLSACYARGGPSKRGVSQLLLAVGVTTTSVSLYWLSLHLYFMAVFGVYFAFRAHRDIFKKHVKTL